MVDAKRQTGRKSKMTFESGSRKVSRFMCPEIQLPTRSLEHVPFKSFKVGDISVPSKLSEPLTVVFVSNAAHIVFEAKGSPALTIRSTDVTADANWNGELVESVADVSPLYQKMLSKVKDGVVLRFNLG